MAKLFLVNIDMHGNEIQNVVLQPLAAAPQNPTVGRIYYDTTESMLKTYDGTQWSSVGAVISVNGQAGTVVLTQDDVGNGSTYVRTHNDLTDALLALINGALQKSGGTMSGAIAMGSNKITGLANGTAATDAATFGQIPTAYTSNPAMDGTASAGTSTSWAKGDHVHPTDTSRMAANLKGVANGVASLDAEGCVPLDQMPWSVLYPASDVVYGYYISNLGSFYEDEQGTSEITGDTEKLYVNISGTPETLYRYDGLHYLPLNAYNDVNPVMDGVANPGTVGWARGDHVHPTDTSRMAASLKGAANGVAELDANGKIPASQIPASFDEVEFGYFNNNTFYSDQALTKVITPEAGKLYVDMLGGNAASIFYYVDNYGWFAAASYLYLGTSSSTAYRGDRGKTAYDHSQLTSGNPHNVTKSDVGLGNVDNKSEATIKSDFTGSIASGNTGFVTGDAVNTAISGVSGQIPTAYTSNPAMDGTASPGTSSNWAKGDHVHPTDTSRQAKITASGILKGNGSGGVSAAVAGTDYAEPGDIPSPTTATPKMDGTAAAGTYTTYARGDHVHPTDTSRMAANLKGAANGVAELDANGKVPSSQLPAYVDDVIEGYYYNSKFYKEAAHTTEIAGETGKIYVDLSTEKTYRWSGTAFVEISASLALGETSSTAYRGDRGKTAYDHSQLTSGNPHNVSKSDVGLGNVDNTSDATKKTNFTGSIASGNTGFVTGGDANTALTSLVKIKIGIIYEGSTSVTVTVPTGYTYFSYYAVKNNAEVTVDASFTLSFESPYYFNIAMVSSITFTTAEQPDSDISVIVYLIKNTAYNGQIEM